MRYTALVALVVLVFAGSVMAQTQIKKEGVSKNPGSTHTVKPPSETAAQETAAEVQKVKSEHSATTKLHHRKGSHAVRSGEAKIAGHDAKDVHSAAQSMQKEAGTVKEGVEKQVKPATSMEPRKK